MVQQDFDPVDFTAKLISIPSCDPPGGELAVAQRVAEKLAELGIECTLDEFLPGRANVVGRIRGTGAKSALVMSAHLDTVPIGAQAWSFDPFAGDIVDGRLRGRGASDMKSAVATFIAAAYRISKRETPLSGDVILAFTAGESANCLGARRLVEQGFQAEIGAFLCGEPSTLDIIVVEKAILWLEAHAKGEMGHVSGAAGVNAINLMAEFLIKLKDLQLDLPSHPLLTTPSVNVGKISGGSAVNVTPDSCTAEIDVRFGPGISVETVMQQLAMVTPDRVELRITDFKAAVEEQPDSAFVAVCAQAIQHKTGNAPAIKGVSYYSDGAILLEGLTVPFAIVGPGDLGMSGQSDETADICRIRDVVDIYVAIAEAWLA
jgi:succinyl-diaminopimelate desuccinylase